MDLGETPKILVVRRDNIGDLLCTTPLLSGLRRRYPSAWIGVLANSYNAPALAGNSDLNAVFAYDKGKHVSGTGAKLTALARRLGLLAALRRERLDLAILAASGFQASAYRFARLAGARHILGYSTPRHRLTPALEAPVGMHEVEATYALLSVLGIHGAPPPMTLNPDAGLRTRIASSAPPGDGPLVGLHISARKPQQRWPVERFAELAHRLHASHGARFMVFWAPGSAQNTTHPGDDEKINSLIAAFSGLPFFPVQTLRLSDLIAGLSLCDAVLCSDGGAMHIAAALGKPIVCFFGNSDAGHWHPWGVPNVLLQKETRNVADISVSEAERAFSRLAGLVGFVPVPPHAHIDE